MDGHVKGRRSRSEEMEKEKDHAPKMSPRPSSFDCIFRSRNAVMIVTNSIAPYSTVAL